MESTAACRPSVVAFAEAATGPVRATTATTAKSFFAPAALFPLELPQPVRPIATVRVNAVMYRLATTVITRFRLGVIDVPLEIGEARVEAAPGGAGAAGKG